MYAEAISSNTKATFDSQWEAGGHFVFINVGKLACTDKESKESITYPAEGSEAEDSICTHI